MLFCNLLKVLNRWTTISVKFADMDKDMNMLDMAQNFPLKIVVFKGEAVKKPGKISDKCQNRGDFFARIMIKYLSLLPKCSYVCSRGNLNKDQSLYPTQEDHKI